MNYGSIKPCDIANGVGVRVSLFVSGCTHHCKNCFNPETWSFDYGRPFTEEAEEELFCALDKSYINGLTLLGGEPFEPQNQQRLLPLLKRMKQRCPGKTIWGYSGYTLEELLPGGRAHCEVTDELLSLLDVLVDGEFKEELKDITLRFRGSSNQRLIDMPRTLESGSVTLWEESLL